MSNIYTDLEERKRILHAEIDKSTNIVIISGAGVSTNSGIPDFRSANGFYSEEDTIKYLHRNMYNANPYSFWKAFKNIFGSKLLQNAEDFTLFKPNIAHTFISDLFEAGKSVSVITQNIDGLYYAVPELIEGENLLEMHGHIKTFKCPTCKKEYSVRYILDNKIPYCNEFIEGEECGEILDTNVVLFGDSINYYEEAVAKVCDADLILVMGTGLEVFPVNQLVKFPTPIPKILINKTNTKLNKYFTHILLGDMDNTLENFKK